jgi:hypothetical protein
MMNNKNKVPFLNKVLAEDKEQPKMCQHLFQHLVGSTVWVSLLTMSSSTDELVGPCSYADVSLGGV